MFFVLMFNSAWIGVKSICYEISYLNALRNTFGRHGDHCDS